MWGKEFKLLKTIEINVQFVCYECFVGLTSNLILDYSEGVDDLINLGSKSERSLGISLIATYISFSTGILVSREVLMILRSLAQRLNVKFTLNIKKNVSSISSKPFPWKFCSWLTLHKMFTLIKDTYIHVNFVKWERGILYISLPFFHYGHSLV